MITGICSSPPYVPGVTAVSVSSVSEIESDGTSVTVAVVLNPRCLMATFEEALGASVNVSVVPYTE